MFIQVNLRGVFSTMGSSQHPVISNVHTSAVMGTKIFQAPLPWVLANWVHFCTSNDPEVLHGRWQSGPWEEPHLWGCQSQRKKSQEQNHCEELVVQQCR